MTIKADNLLLVESLNINDVRETYPWHTVFKEIELTLIIDHYTVSIKGIPRTTIELDAIIKQTHAFFDDFAEKPVDVKEIII